MTALSVLRTHCPACDKPLSLHERYNGGVCADWACRHRRVETTRLAERETRIAQLHRDAAAGNSAALHAPVIQLRLYAAKLVPLPTADRQALQEHLLSLEPSVTAMREAAQAAHPAAQADPGQPPRDGQIEDLLGQVCAACTGHCCQQGAGQDAFLDTRTLLASWQRYPDADYRQIVQKYLAALPDQHYERSCVYHGDQGCALPREKRSAICNEWACDGLQEARAIAQNGKIRRMFIIRDDPGYPPQGRFVPALAAD